MGTRVVQGPAEAMGCEGGSSRNAHRVIVESGFTREGIVTQEGVAIVWINVGRAAMGDRGRGVTLKGFC